MISLSSAPIGFRSDNLLLFYIDGSRNGHRGADLIHLYERLSDQFAAIPGVVGVTHSRSPLLNGSASISQMRFPVGDRDAWRHNVGDGFLTVFGIPLLLGRDLTSQDSAGAPPVVVVNRKLAQSYFAGDAIGRELRNSGKAWRIVGVCEDAKYDELRSDVPPTVYFPWRQDAARLAGIHFALRTAVDPHSLVTSVRKAVAALDPALPVANVRTQREQINRGIARERTFAALALFFSAVAILLACIGIYGVLAYAVSRRTGEFGIRLALGATPTGISWLVVRSMLPPVAAAVVVGIPAALAASKVVKAMLYGVEPNDPATLIAAVAVIAVCATAAALIPSLRAAKCDPAVALRYD